MEKLGYPCRQERSTTSCIGCEYERPVLDHDNFEVWALWGYVQTQWRVVVGERLLYIGLDYNAVKILADALGIDLEPATLNKLRLLEREFLAKRNK